MLTLKKVAVTGGVAAGKTTVCQLFKDLGASVVSADEIVHQLLSSGTPVGRQIIHLLGPEIINGSVLDRKKIAAKVFSNPELLRSLERLIHPAVFDEIDKRYKQAKRQSTHSLFLVEIPLLYEAKQEQRFHAVIAVRAPKELCEKRYVAHSGFPAEEFEKRMLRQIDPAEKAARADFIIENDGDLEHLKTQVREIYTQLHSTGV